MNKIKEGIFERKVTSQPKQIDSNEIYNPSLKNYSCKIDPINNEKVDEYIRASIHQRPIHRCITHGSDKKGRNLNSNLSKKGSIRAIKEINLITLSPFTTFDDGEEEKVTKKLNIFQKKDFEEAKAELGIHIKKQLAAMSIKINTNNKLIPYTSFSRKFKKMIL